MDKKKNANPAQVPITPQPIWGSKQLSEGSLTPPEWWFFYKGELYPMRACFDVEAMPVEEFMSMPLMPHLSDPKAIFGDPTIVMPLANHLEVIVGQEYPSMLVGNEVATLRVEEVVPHDPPDGFKDVIMVHAQEATLYPISAPLPENATMMPAAPPAPPMLHVVDAASGKAVVKK